MASLVAIVVVLTHRITHRINSNLALYVLYSIGRALRQQPDGDPCSKGAFLVAAAVSSKACWLLL